MKFESSMLNRGKTMKTTTTDSQNHINQLWYLTQLDEKSGPFSYFEIAQKLKHGEITFSTLISCEEDYQVSEIRSYACFDYIEIQNAIEATSPAHTPVDYLRVHTRMDCNTNILFLNNQESAGQYNLIEIGAGGFKIKTSEKLPNKIEHMDVLIVDIEELNIPTFKATATLVASHSKSTPQGQINFYSFKFENILPQTKETIMKANLDLFYMNEIRINNEYSFENEQLYSL